MERKKPSLEQPFVGKMLIANKGTATGSVGKFTLVKTIENYVIIVSSVGYKSDIIMVHSDNFLMIYL